MLGVFRHVKNRINGQFNRNEFKKLMEETNYLKKIIIKDYDLIQMNEFKNNLNYHYYSYLLLSISRILLFNIELSPYVYRKKLIPFKKYIRMKPIEDTTMEEYPFSDMNNTHQNNNKNYYETYFETSCSDPFFKEKFKNYCIFSKTKYPGFNYKPYDELENSMTKDGDDDINDDYDDVEFLTIYPPLKDFDYENCFNLCLDILIKSKEFLININKFIYQSNSSKIKYYYYTGFYLYHAGMFCMTAYANLRDESMKEYIEFFHKQIKIMYRHAPYLSYFYSQIYDKAKKEAYAAYLDDTILFCPKLF